MCSHVTSQGLGMQLSLSAGSLPACYRLTLILKLPFCCLFTVEEVEHCKLGFRQAHIQRNILQMHANARIC